MNIVPQPANVACKKQRHVINLLKIWSTRQASGVVKLWGTYWAMRILSGGASLADLSAPWPSLERFSTNKDLLGFSASICSASFAPSYRNRKSIEQRITSPTQELQGLYYSSCSSCSSYSSYSSKEILAITGFNLNGCLSLSATVLITCNPFYRAHRWHGI